MFSEMDAYLENVFDNIEQSPFDLENLIRHLFNFCFIVNARKEKNSNIKVYLVKLFVCLVAKDLQIVFL